MPGPRWFGSGAKVLYILAIRATDTLLAFAFVWSHTVFFSYYGQITPRLWGIGALEDQNLAGVVMLLEGSLVTLALFGWLFLGWLSDGELVDQLTAAGVTPERAARAVRYRTAGKCPCLSVDRARRRSHVAPRVGPERVSLGKHPSRDGRADQ